MHCDILESDSELLQIPATHHVSRVTRPAMSQ